MTIDPEHEDELRLLTRELFGSDEEPDVEPGVEPDAKRQNVVPAEGQTVPPPKGDELREFVRKLFNGNADDHVRN